MNFKQRKMAQRSFRRMAQSYAHMADTELRILEMVRGDDELEIECARMAETLIQRGEHYKALAQVFGNPQLVEAVEEY